MNKDEIGGNPAPAVRKNRVMGQDDDMTIVIEGKRSLQGKIQERYGYESDQAENEVKDCETRNDYRW